MSRRGRPLRPEEEALWKKVADSAAPLNPKAKASKAPLIQPTKPAPPPRDPILPFNIGDRALAKPQGLTLSPAIAEQMGAAPVEMDSKSFRNLKRGKLSPEARIDLHGMTMDQAHGALVPFVLDAHQAGKRLVLVITGKGKSRDDGGPIPMRRGALRHAVPGWLRAPGLGNVVLQITEAHQKHGGSGAYYVYLRRRR